MSPEGADADSKDCLSQHLPQHTPLDHNSLIVASASGGPGTGFELSPGPGRSLAPGQEADINARGGSGSGGASGNHIRILVYVGRVDWDGCFYVPSKRLPL